MLDTYSLNVSHNDFKKVDRAKQPAKQIENPNIEIRNKLRDKSQIGKIQNIKSEGSLFGILNILVI